MRRVLCLLLGVASLAHAADAPLGASKLLVQDPSGDPLRRKVVVVGSVPAGSTVALPGDPTIGGATLTIVTAAACRRSRRSTCRRRAGRRCRRRASSTRTA
jgi:hypothetical protein